MLPPRPGRVSCCAIAVALTGLMVASCGSSSNNSSTAPTTPTPVPPIVYSNILVGAGDIGLCGLAGAGLTGALLDGQDGNVITMGDHAYHDGTLQQFRDCYDPFWGRHLSRTHPVPGNHEYNQPGALPYFTYFAGAAGQVGQGYYAYRAGSWLILALNSNIPMDTGSAQYAWISEQLRSFSGRCVGAYVHHPRYSSGPNGNNAFMQPVWQLLFEAGVEFLLAGHDHMYERFARQDALGVADSTRGLRQFVVGTGGGDLYATATLRPNSEARYSGWGIIRLVLEDTRFSWEFIPTTPGAFRDTGSDSCH